MSTLKKQLPNLITLLNLFSGGIAVFYAIDNQFEAAALFVCLGIFFDFFDGFAARALKVQSDLGLQLDSLADMVTSGLVPGIVMCRLLDMAWSDYALGTSWQDDTSWLSLSLTPVALFGLIITLASAYRLANFNVDEDQQSYFKGLPTPANALLILSLPFLLNTIENSDLNEVLTNPWVLMGITVLSAYLLNAKFKLFALKFKNYGVKDNKMRYGFLLLTLILLVVLKLVAVPLIILLYIIISLFNQKHIN